MSTPPDLGPLPEVGYLGDDVSYGYDSVDMRDFGLHGYMLGVTAGIEQCADRVRAEADRRTGAARTALLNMADVLRRALPSAPTK